MECPACGTRVGARARAQGAKGTQGSLMTGMTRRRGKCSCQGRDPGRLEGMGVDPEQARRVAASLFDAKGNYAPRSSGAWQEGDTMDATLARLAQSGAGAASVGRTVNVNLITNGRTRTVDTSEAGATSLIETLQAASLAAGR